MFSFLYVCLIYSNSKMPAHTISVMDRLPGRRENGNGIYKMVKRYFEG